jgi:threonine dehydrogenase-like Zn-dependent dehydrogenase
MADLCTYGRIKPEKMATHVFKGFDNVEKALMLMKEKPRDLIKPVVLLDE